jgi:hypothetical protein
VTTNFLSRSAEVRQVKLQVLSQQSKQFKLLASQREARSPIKIDECHAEENGKAKYRAERPPAPIRRNLRPMPKIGRGCQTRNNISHQILAKAPDESRDVHASGYSKLAEAYFPFVLCQSVPRGAIYCVKQCRLDQCQSR